jgi:hypothetical protein
MTKRIPLSFAVLLLLFSASLLSWQVWSHGPDGSWELLRTLVVRDEEDAQAIEPLALLREVITPSPLRGPRDGRAGDLTADGILYETNRHRATENAKPLSRNATLDKAAMDKIDDMLAQQYFDHVSPDGRGPADVVTAAGYAYIRVGENLALGNFASDEALVQAWMDSPGHRENVMSKGFTEIGIAAKRGVFEGRETWLAVQMFGTPESACTAPDPALHTRLATERTQLKEIETRLAQMRSSMDALAARVEALFQEARALNRRGNEKIREGNEEMERGNRIYRETGDESQARPHWNRAEELHREGERLHEQARQKQREAETKQEELRAVQRTYNSEVNIFNTRRRELVSLTERYNRQVRVFNRCVQSFQ